ncbi:Disease resistance protein [Penicillium concentricum]|uniref:Disease resistance protein n=1 Tax=Penicillium concentricum TaxID=293559 RepID=A0A9W9V2V3_9EURO|nr:Disease resistance protein [Penicillium concentricum]KAJ5365664.1 Disease resistance protein [Penicillium concentricum]
MSLKKLSLNSYRIGWICPLEVEQIAAMEMLDEEHQPLPQSRGDTNVYNLGSINNHNVVIAGLPRAGNCSAATVVTQMRMTFPDLKYVLLVGIGGGVPTKTECGTIRLGHVVVSDPAGIHSGAVQYDHGKAKGGHFERKGFLAPPPTALLNAAREVAVRRQRMDYDPIWKNLERTQTSPRLRRRFKFPGAANDHLYPSTHTHRQEGISCEDGGCDPSQRIERPTDKEDDSFIVVHRGTIASGELVIKDAELRDDLAQTHGVLCFEMEAAGALTDFPCIVIRGISDYCDSHKNDQWHGYAAAVAAAYARQLFFHMSIEEEQRNLDATPTTFELPLNLSEISEVTRFVAREDSLKRIQEILDATAGRRTAVVHGLGGIGKTQLAIAYMKQNRSHYSARIWLDAKNETALKESFSRVAEWIVRHHPSATYVAAASESQELDEIVKAVKQWLDEPMNDRWLIIYDNYDNPLLRNRTGKRPSSASFVEADTNDNDDDLTKAFDLQKFLPETDHGAIVVTTRSSMVKLGQRLHLRKLEDINDSLDVLASVSGREDLRQDPAATDLVRQLDGLPLALATAGAYLEQVSISCTDYLQLYRESWQQLHEKTPPLGAYDQTLYSTWNLSYRYIQQQSPIAAMLLRQWAYFASEDLWYDLLKDCGPEKPEWLGSLTKDKLTFHASLRLLCSHGLVEADPTTKLQRVESRGYSVHGCVHSWMIHVLNPGLDKSLAWIAVECVATHVPTEDEPNFWLIQRRLIAHADRCLEILRNLEIEDEDVAPLFSLGYLYADQGRFQEAEAMYERALEGYEKAWGREHMSTLDTVNNLGTIYENQGRLQEAEAMYERALEGCEKAWGREHTSTLGTVSNLGILYKEQGRLQEAEAMYERALEGCEKAWGREHTSTLGTVSNLGILYKEQGRLQEAEAMYERALKGYEKAWGREHTSTLDTVSNLGILYKEQGRLQEAEAMYERALEGCEKAWGREHTSTLGAVNNLGALYAIQGRLQEAEAMYERALEGKEKAWGREHTSTLDTVHNLGALYKEQGRLQEAEAMYERALEGCEKAWGRRHKSTLDTVSNLGTLYTYQGRLQEAEAMYERALEGYEAAFGATSPLTYIPALHTLKNFGLLCESNGKVDTALLYYQRGLVGTEIVWGQNSEQYTWLSNQLSSIQRGTSNISDGDESVQKKTTMMGTKWRKVRAKLSGMYKPK